MCTEGATAKKGKRDERRRMRRKRAAWGKDEGDGSALLIEKRRDASEIVRRRGGIHVASKCRFVVNRVMWCNQNPVQCRYYYGYITFSQTAQRVQVKAKQQYARSSIAPRYQTTPRHALAAILAESGSACLHGKQQQPARLLAIGGSRHSWEGCGEAGFGS